MTGTAIIIGGGWSGVAAALASKRCGAGRVVVLERTDMLLGCGLSGGIMRNNGRHTAAEELAAMGAGALFEITDSVGTHRGIDFPGHKHAWLYSTTKIEPVVRRFLDDRQIEIRFRSRVVDLETGGGRVFTAVLSDDSRIVGDAFVETTGSAGSTGNCTRFGNGCAMCSLRCPTYGPRVSLTDRIGLEDYVGMRKDGGIGTFSGSFELRKNSLSPELQDELNVKGAVVIPLPAEMKHAEVLDKKSCKQYALPEYADNIILLDTGDVAKIMTPYFPVDQLRLLPGLENVLIGTGAGHANSVRFLSRAPRDNALTVEGYDNFFCAGEKSGFFVGHTEAIVTGTLAGYNAARHLAGKSPFVLPTSLVCGDIIFAEQEGLQTEEGLIKRYTFSGSDYFKRMREKSFYSTDSREIAERVRRAGCNDLFAGDA